MSIHRPQYGKYKYLYSRGNIHIFGYFNFWRYKYIEVTTEQITSGEIYKMIR